MTDLKPKTKATNKPRIITVLFPTIAANLGSFFVGYILGYPSPIEKEVNNLGILDNTTYPIFGSLQCFFAIIGVIFVFLLVDFFGKKALIIFFVVPNALGWVLISIGYNWIVMLVGRSLTGIALGALCCLIPIYVADISPANMRGFYGSFFAHFFLMGILSSHFLGIFLSFRWMAVACIVVLLIHILLFSFQPYSPNWLVTQKQEKRALKALQYLRGPKYDSRPEFDEIKKVVEENVYNSVCQRFTILFRETNYLKTVLKVGLLFAFLELTGITVAGTYSVSILSSSRLIPPKIASLLPTFFQSVAVFLCTLVVDRVGRKILLILSSVGVAFSHIINSVYFFGSDRLWTHCYTVANSSSPILSSSGVNSEAFCDYISLLPIIALIFLKASYGFGWGPVPWIIMGESLPTKVRSIGAGVCILFLLIFSGGQALIFPFFARLLGAYIVYLIFLSLNILSGLYVFLFIPETKNKNLEEIEGLFKGKTFFIPFKCSDIFQRRYVYDVENAEE